MRSILAGRCAIVSLIGPERTIRMIWHERWWTIGRGPIWWRRLGSPRGSCAESYMWVLRMEMFILPTVGIALVGVCVYIIDLISWDVGKSAASSVDMCFIKPGCHGSGDRSEERRRESHTTTLVLPTRVKSQPKNYSVRSYLLNAEQTQVSSPQLRGWVSCIRSFGCMESREPRSWP